MQERFERAFKKEVAKIAVFRNGKMLMGIRQDNGKWTEPGGHLNKGEDPREGALRELREETGIRLPGSSLELLGAKEVTPPDKKEPIKVHVYKADLSKEPRVSTEKDPDDEVFGWNWVPIKNQRLPKVVDANLHVPHATNCIHFFLGLEKAASRYLKEWALDVPNQAVQTYLQIQADKKALSKGQKKPK